MAQTQASLDAGADVDLPDKWHRTHLMLAVANNHKQEAALLIAHGASLNPPNCPGCFGMNGANPNAPMCTLCFAHTPDIADLLLAHGADVNGRDVIGSGGSPLHFLAGQEVARLSSRTTQM
jgi:ankyrin repeat protein